MVRFPSPSVTKIKSCMCDLSIFFSFCLELPVCKNSKIIFKGFRQRKIDKYHENLKQKQKTGWKKIPQIIYFMLLFLVSSQPYCSKKVVILSKQSIDSKYKYFHGFVQFRINVNLHFCALIFVNTMLTKLLLELQYRTLCSCIVRKPQNLIKSPTWF